MPTKLLDIRMHDGSRHFGDLPQTFPWEMLLAHLQQMPGARVTGFVSDLVTEAWLDFTLHENEFSNNDQFGDYWFFVKDPACPDAILHTVLDYCAQLLV